MCYGSRHKHLLPCQGGEGRQIQISHVPENEGCRTYGATLLDVELDVGYCWPVLIDRHEENEVARELVSAVGSNRRTLSYFLFTR